METTRDGRDIDRTLGTLSGEAAQQEIEKPEEAYPAQPKPAEISTGETYYDQPVLKEPVWKWYVPLYFYLGGAAGAASVFGAVATLTGHRRLARRCRWFGLAGDVLGSACLIADLGRPSRFLNMLRVFRPSSPMSVGTWVLAGSGAMNSAAIVLGDRTLGDAADVGAGVLGLPLAGYTAVLLTHTAVPSWLYARRSLPVAFTMMSASSAASLLELVESHRAVRRFALLGKAADLLGGVAVELELARTPRARRSLTNGLWWAARALTAASLVATVARRRRLAGVLGTAGGLAARFGVMQAGKRSARDPRATFEPQRRKTC